MRSDADVAIIGGGVIGVAVAYHLSRDGYRVILLERGDLVCGSSGANSGSISTQTKSSGLLKMIVASAHMFPSLSLELESDLEYERRGGMVIVETEEEWKYAQRMVEDQRRTGLPMEVLSPGEARELEPALSPTIVGATYNPDFTLVNPQRLTLAYARAARRLSAEILTRTPVTGIEVQGGRVLGVRTPQGGVHASWVVNAAGVQAPAMGRMVGVEHDIRPRRGQLLLTEPRPGLVHRKMTAVSDILAKYRARTGEGSRLGLGMNLRPTRAGNILLGATNEVAGEDISATFEAVRTISSYAIRIVPTLRGVRIIRTWAGLRPVTPDGIPLLGAVGGPEGYLVAAGHGGDGVGLAPLTACYLAKVVASEGKGLTMAKFLATL